MKRKHAQVFKPVLRSYTVLITEDGFDPQPPIGAIDGDCLMINFPPKITIGVEEIYKEQIKIAQNSAAKWRRTHLQELDRYNNITIKEAIRLSLKRWLAK
jgi:hypothetical protein